MCAWGGGNVRGKIAIGKLRAKREGGQKKARRGEKRKRIGRIRVISWGAREKSDGRNGKSIATRATKEEKGKKESEKKRKKNDWDLADWGGFITGGQSRGGEELKGTALRKRFDCPKRGYTAKKENKNKKKKRIGARKKKRSRKGPESWSKKGTIRVKS